MNLYLIQRYSESTLMITADPSTWHQLDNETIFFEPSEEAEVLRGTCIILGNSVRFLGIVNRQFDMEFGERAYVLAYHEPIVKKLSTHIRLVRLTFTSLFERTHGFNQDSRIW